MVTKVGEGGGRESSFLSHHQHHGRLSVRKEDRSFRVVSLCWQTSSIIETGISLIVWSCLKETGNSLNSPNKVQVTLLRNGKTLKRSLRAKTGMNVTIRLRDRK